MKTAVFGNGCFWCTEAVFRMLMGVKEVEPGYSGGSTGSPQAAPTYEDVSSGRTGHAEAIRITYDESIISYKDLLTVFFGSHDPTTLNRQGNDVGAQYRSIIFYQNDAEKAAAEEYVVELQQSLKDPSTGSTGLTTSPHSAGASRIVTEVKKFGVFYPAEDYHKKYFENNRSAPYCQIVIEPKVEKVRERFRGLLVEGGA